MPWKPGKERQRNRTWKWRIAEKKIGVWLVGGYGSNIVRFWFDDAVKQRNNNNNNNNVFVFFIGVFFRFSILFFFSFGVFCLLGFSIFS
jgi:hypothetical protein